MSERRPADRMRRELGVAAVVTAVLLVLGPRPAARQLVADLETAVAASETGRPEAALQSLEAALAFEPALASLHPAAARLALDAGRIDAARRHLEAAASHAHDPADVECLRILTGDFEGNLSATATPGLECLKDRGTVRSWVATSLRAGSLRVAADLLVSWLAEDPEDLESWEDLAGLRTATDAQSAQAVILQAFSHQPGGTPILDSLLSLARHTTDASEQAQTAASVGRLFASYRRWEVAAAAWSLAVSARGDFPQASAYLGLARSRLGMDGLPDLEGAVEQAPEDPVVHMLLGQALLESGDIEGALRELELGHSLDPANPSLLAALGEARGRSGDYRGAADALLQAAGDAPQEEGFWLLLAAFSLQNDFQVGTLGLAAARNAAALSPRDPAALSALGFAWHVAGESILAERLLARSIRQDPSGAVAWYRYGLMLLDLGRNAEARPALEAASRFSADEQTKFLAERALARFSAGGE